MGRLAVLMYHNITANESESVGLTISASKFEAQLQLLKSQDYHTPFVSELEDAGKLPEKSVVVTFDDVTENQLQFAVPLLKKYKIKATFFVPFFYLGKTDSWNQGGDATGEKIMTVSQLQSLDPQWIELAHHSYYHRRYANLTADEIQQDFDLAQQCIVENSLKVYPALAYPYGNFPKRGKKKTAFFALLEKNDIKIAFRIGNRVNLFPLRNKFAVQRIDVKGEYSLNRFRWKLRWGKKWLF